MSDDPLDVWHTSESFSRTIARMPLSIDSTALNDFRACPKRYELRYVRGFVRREMNPHLIFGSALHRGREVYGLERINGATHDEAVERGLRALLRLITDAQGRVALGESGESTKRPDTLVQAYVALCDAFEQDALTTLCLNYAPALELKWTIASGYLNSRGEPIKLFGTFDRLALSADQMLWCIDTKTSKSETRHDAWSPHMQVSMYSWAAPRIASRIASHFGGMIIEAVQVGVSFTRCTRIGPIKRTPEELDEWFIGLGNTFESIERCATRDYWPMHEASCFGCAYRSVCSANPSARDNILSSSFTRMG